MGRVVRRYPTKIGDILGELPGHEGRRHYEIFSVPVGRSCMCAVLGIGRNRLYKAASGLVDARFACNVPLHRSCPKARSVDAFLLYQHGTVAEILPTGPGPGNMCSNVDHNAYLDFPSPPGFLCPTNPKRANILTKMT